MLFTWPNPLLLNTEYLEWFVSGSRFPYTSPLFFPEDQNKSPLKNAIPLRPALGSPESNASAWILTLIFLLQPPVTASKDQSAPFPELCTPSLCLPLRCQVNTYDLPSDQVNIYHTWPYNLLVIWAWTTILPPSLSIPTDKTGLPTWVSQASYEVKWGQTADATWELVLNLLENHRFTFPLSISPFSELS